MPLHLFTSQTPHWNTPSFWTWTQLKCSQCPFYAICALIFFNLFEFNRSVCAQLSRSLYYQPAKQSISHLNALTSDTENDQLFLFLFFWNYLPKIILSTYILEPSLCYSCQHAWANEGKRKSHIWSEYIAWISSLSY